MKVKLFAVLASLLASVTIHAAVPLRWTVETSRATPATFEAYHGETLALEAALQSYGKPLEAPSNYSLYWQTNGMGSTYWSVPVRVPSSSTGTGTSHSNLMYATWSPTNDVGAKVYNCFIGQPGTIYHAAFQLRLRPSPGATPNELPLPQKVIDFAKVTVLNPPWSGGGGGGVDTNAVRDIIHKTVDGSARYTPKYLWVYDCADSYPEAAHEYYSSRGNGKTDGGCSSVRDGGFLYRNFDYPFDDRAEFVVHMSSGPARFASVGVAQVDTNLTEQIVTSGKPSRWYKALPGATVDGINENGVSCNINVVDGPVTNGWHTTGNLHPLGAIRWILDHATNAQHGAEYIAANIRFPQGWAQNFHYMVADATSTYIVENGEAYPVPSASSPTGALPALTNFRLYPTRDTSGEGQERYDLLLGGANITNAWYTRAYLRSTNPYWYSEFHSDDFWHVAVTEWAKKPKEEHRGESFDGESWWQTVHTSVYDITNRTLSICVQETDDWYTFQVPASSLAGSVDEGKVREIVRPIVAASTNNLRRVDDMAVYEKKWQWFSGSQEYADREMEFRTAPDVSINYIPFFDTESGKWDLPSHSAEFGAISDTWTSGNETNASAEVLETFYVPYGTAITNVLIYKLVSAPGSDSLATTNGVNAAIEAHHDDTKMGKSGTQNIETSWQPTYNNEPLFFFDLYYWQMNANLIKVPWGSLLYKPTTLSGYGITDAIEANTQLGFSSPEWVNDSLWFRGDLKVLVNSWDFLLAGGLTVKQPLPAYLASGEWDTNTGTNRFARLGDIPPTSETIRTYDRVRQCWWVLEMVNGVPTWTVED